MTLRLRPKWLRNRGIERITRVGCAGMDLHWEHEPQRTIPSAQITAILGRSLPGRTLVSQQPLSGGRRNSHHRLELDDGSQWVLRLYAAADGRHEVEVAVHELVARAVPVPRIIDADYRPEICSLPFALLEYVEGTTLDVLVSQGRTPGRELFVELGWKLQAVHMHRYERIGFFDHELRVVEIIPGLVDLYAPFVETAAQYLGPTRAAALLELVRRHAPALAELDRSSALVHGDFRPANLMVREERLVALLDWEFAMAGHALADLGQFMRDEDELPGGAMEALVSGYEQAAGRSLPDDFTTLCRLRDLLNLLQMLKASGSRPRQQAECLRLIDRTIRLALPGHQG